VNDKAEIDYIVNPGKRHKLIKVDIEGNHYFDTRTIRERMFLLPASLQFSRGRYSESYLRRDEESITNLYEENGFRDVKVSSKVVDTDLTNQGRISVTIHIDEGPQWIISKLDVDGIAQLDRKTILDKLSSTEGQPFSEFEVAVDRDNILSEYFSQGFPNATFEWSSKPGAAPNRVELRFTISEGQRRFVRQVLTSGLVTTQAQLVNRNILLNPGDPLSQPKMVETQRRLYDLGIFSEVNTAIQNPAGDTQNKYIIYQMDEANKYSIATGFGAQIGRIGGGNNLNAPAGTAGFAPRVSFDVSRLNLRGLGQTLSFRSRLSNIEQLGLLNYTVPRPYDLQNLTLTFTILYNDTKNIRTFDAKKEEGSVQISQKLSKADTALYRFSYRNTSVSALAINPLLVPLYSQPVRIGILSGSFIQDRRDDPTDSHKGIYNTVDFGYASNAFGSQSSFTRFLGRNTSYHQITKKLVLARSVNFGWLAPFTKQPQNPNVVQAADIYSGAALEDIPLAERLFSGGGSSHRGFPENQAGPRDSGTGFPVGRPGSSFRQRGAAVSAARRDPGRRPFLGCRQRLQQAAGHLLRVQPTAPDAAGDDKRSHLAAGGFRIQLHGARDRIRNSIPHADRAGAPGPGLQPERHAFRRLRGVFGHAVAGLRIIQSGWIARAGAQERPHEPISVSLLDRAGILTMMALFFFLAVFTCRAETIDQIAVVVGNSVITESEILREIRLTAFLNGAPLDFSPATKRKTAERLVEQRLVPMRSPGACIHCPLQQGAQEMLKQIKDRFPNPAAYQQELVRVGVSEEELKAHLARQLATLSFLDFRFRPGIQIGEDEMKKYFDERLGPDLKRVQPGGSFSLNDYRPQVQEALVGERIDTASDAWLKEVRNRTRIEFRPQVFAPEPPKQEASK
jgi:Outer membrane protein/protective antigen OMA87